MFGQTATYGIEFQIRRNARSDRKSSCRMPPAGRRLFTPDPDAVRPTLTTPERVSWWSAGPVGLPPRDLMHGRGSSVTLQRASYFDLKKSGVRR
jgi:hypothetical protein